MTFTVASALESFNSNEAAKGFKKTLGAAIVGLVLSFGLAVTLWLRKKTLRFA